MAGTILCSPKYRLVYRLMYSYDVLPMANSGLQSNFRCIQNHYHQWFGNLRAIRFYSNNQLGHNLYRVGMFRIGTNILDQ
jgi:hypothetical protein